MSDQKSVLKAALKATIAEQDMFVYSGGLYEKSVEQAISTIAGARHKDKVTIILTTDGGDPHAAYRFGRSARQKG